jgi:hypothetical protein
MTDFDRLPHKIGNFLRKSVIQRDLIAGDETVKNAGEWGTRGDRQAVTILCVGDDRNPPFDAEQGKLRQI